MNPISAILVVKDNPPHIQESIASIEDFVSEIIIVDIGIEESLKTVLLENKKIRILSYQTVPYIELIREKLKKEASEDYILFLDPDEKLTLDLKKILSSHLTDYDYFSIPRKNIIFGKWMKNSRWWPDYQVRLFKKDKVIWPKQIHKQPISSGGGYEVEIKEGLAITHYNYESIDEYIFKAIRYAKAEASEHASSEEEFTITQATKQATSEFISRFFAGDGFKDGIHGFILSFFQMIYPFLVYFYYLELMKFKTSTTEKELIQSSNSFFSTTYKESRFWKNKKSNLTIKERIVEKII